MEIHNFGHILVNTDDIESFKVSKSTFSGSRNTMGISNLLSCAYFVPDQVAITKIHDFCHIFTNNDDRQSFEVATSTFTGSGETMVASIMFS